MIAIVETGGRQFRVRAGERVRVGRLSGKVGESVTLSRVLGVGEGTELRTGNPVAGAAVVGEIVDQGRSKKVIIFKKRRRKRYRRLRGHRQAYTTLLIKEIRVEA
ncbi:MAG: 50S ribosomal protein L21 [Nitrospirae bacterium]|nr:50S ribosomal protein L21 [Nitrospirota bacterium]